MRVCTLHIPHNVYSTLFKHFSQANIYKCSLLFYLFPDVDIQASCLFWFLDAWICSPVLTHCTICPFIYCGLFIYLLWLDDCTGSSLLWHAFSKSFFSSMLSLDTLHCGAQSFSFWRLFLWSSHLWLQELWNIGSAVVMHGLSCST